MAAYLIKNVFFLPRTVQLTVSNALVGRIIGRGGMKINSIQVKDYSPVRYCRSFYHSHSRNGLSIVIVLNRSVLISRVGSFMHVTM